MKTADLLKKLILLQRPIFPTPDQHHDFEAQGEQDRGRDQRSKERDRLRMRRGRPLRDPRRPLLDTDSAQVVCGVARGG